VVIGLLYGGGDYGKTLEISTRCGQDSDCNPATAGGIMGCIKGYSDIPEYWKQGLDKVEDMDFKYTTMSLNDVYGMSFKHALVNIEKHGGSVSDNEVTLKAQEPATVRYEKGFPGHFPVEIIGINGGSHKLDVKTPSYSFEFTGIGFVVRGSSKPGQNTSRNSVNQIEVYVDGKLSEKAKLPVDYRQRRTDVCWRYNLERGKHKVRIELKNPVTGSYVYLSDILIYDKKK